MRKETLFQRIDEEREELWSMADQIFDNPEYEGEDFGRWSADRLFKKKRIFRRNGSWRL